MKVSFVDLLPQYSNLKVEIDAELKNIILTSSFIGGIAVEEFENLLCDLEHRDCSVGLKSGTSALILALKSLELPEKSEVITTTLTAVPTVEAIVQAGLRPVLCDVRNPWSIQMFDHVRGVSIKRKIGIFFLSVKYFFEELLIKRANIVTAYSKGIKDWLLDYIGMSLNKIKIIGPHVDLKKFNIEKIKKSKL